MQMEKVAGNQAAQLQLPPGFRFHPTDEELVEHYLCRKAAAHPFPIQIIAEVDLYKFDPWDLPQRALFGEKEWYFFSPRDRKYPNGARPNRAAASGYWKATGTDKPISSDGPGGFRKLGVKKALVFYKGRAPKGVKTNWIMHEYRLIGDNINKTPSTRRKGSLRLDDWVLCRIYKKSKISQTKHFAAPSCTEAEEESCLEEVLASLPDIDDSKLCLPRLGSFQSLLDQDHIMDSFLAVDASETANRSSAIHQPAQRRTHDNHPPSAAFDTEMKPNLRESTFKDVEFQQSQLQSSHQAQHLQKNGNNLTEMLQNYSRTFRQKGRMIGSYAMQEDEVQSTCRSPKFSQINQQQSHQQLQQPQQQHPQDMKVSGGLAPPGGLALPVAFCSPKYTIQRSDHMNCNPKLESDTQIFSKAAEFYIKS